MNTQHLAQDLLTAYGQIAGVPGLRFEAHGCARLVFEQSVAIDLEIDQGADCIHVYGVLGLVPLGDCEALYRQLLEGNLFGSETGGATLAIDAAQNEALLCRRVELATADPAGFAQTLEEFAGLLRQWQQRFDSGELVPSRGEPATAHGEWQGAYVRG